MRKSERIELIKTIITNHKITRQNDLLAKLEEASGLLMTQATISRDMNELGIVKIPLKDGSYMYSLPEDKEAKPESQPIGVKDVVRHLSPENDEVPTMLSLSLVPGNGKFVKRTLLEIFPAHIMSVIADDDSVLIIALSREAALEIRRELTTWLTS